MRDFCKKIFVGVGFIIAGVAAVNTVAAVTRNSIPADDAESVSLFAYSSADGKGGLKLAWLDGTEWVLFGDGKDFLKSDFGPWGSMKKMYSPVLCKTKDGWRCLFWVSDKKETVASADSHDLLNWKPQRYAVNDSARKFLKEVTVMPKDTSVMIDGKITAGTLTSISTKDRDAINRYIQERGEKERKENHLMKDDSSFFGTLKPVNVSARRINEKNPVNISENLIGIFFEDISRSADGGLYAEMIENRDFEYSFSDTWRKGWGPAYGWELEGSVTDTVVPISNVSPIHENNPHYVRFLSAPVERKLINGGFDGISLKKGEKYIFSLFGRLPEVKHATLNVSVVDSLGIPVASGKIKLEGKEWNNREITLRANKDVKGGRLVLTVPANIACDIDMISLFPVNTYKGRRNGLRRDLAETLEALHPKFVRFPGGCVAHGDGIDDMYDWKGSIGPLESRKPLRNLWGYHQTRGLGYHEYFLWCEDMGAEPLPVLAAGVPCQNSGVAWSGSVNELTSKGQQGGLPLEMMDGYIQDVLDLIEYANGPADSAWGRKRAEAGHPEPFNLKYIGIGNEDMITEVFEERFKLINDAVKKNYPEITVVGTVGPFYEGSDYDEGWRFAKEQNVDMVDEHYYVSPGWFIENGDYYDNYDRNGTKVYLGEYASHLPGRPSNLEAALSIALYLTGVERNGDVVAMTSYAPLLAKKKRVNWSPDLIYFDNDGITLTPDYYVQQLYSVNDGDRYIPFNLSLDNASEDVAKRVGLSVVKDSKTGDIIMKYANLLPVPTTLSLSKTDLGLTDAEKIKEATVLTGSPADTDVVPQPTAAEFTGENLTYGAPAYSFTVIRLGK